MFANTLRYDNIGKVIYAHNGRIAVVKSGESLCWMTAEAFSQYRFDFTRREAYIVAVLIFML